MEELKIIGLMSGTSLDGLDIAACAFQKDSHWHYKIEFAQTISYSEKLIKALQHLDAASAFEYARTDHELGRFFGIQVSKFINESGFQANYISSHGHTVFHQPEKHFTTQIGHPSAIAALTKTPVIGDFRTVDVHLDGQGAPLVPVGDLHLFPKYKYCLNLGGIANISAKGGEEIVAFDICIANMALNFLAQKNGKLFDLDGEIAGSGKVIPSLLEQLNRIEFHDQLPPKSIGKEWFDSELKPLLENSLRAEKTANVMATTCEHIAIQIARQTSEPGTILMTGGGAKNHFLVQRISELSVSKIYIPNTELIEFKEALIFAFLGALHVRKEVNVLKSVTGSSQSHIGGCIYTPFRA